MTMIRPSAALRNEYSDLSRIPFSTGSSMRRSLSCGFCMSVWRSGGTCHKPGAYDKHPMQR